MFSSSYIFAKTNPRSSRTVSLRQLIVANSYYRQYYYMLYLYIRTS